MRSFTDAEGASPAFDQRVILHDVSWAQYEAALAIRGDSSGTRIAYLEGELELMTPSVSHEFIKKNPNTVQAVVNAMVRANRWIAKATPQQIVDLMPDEYKAGSPSLYKQGLLKNMIGYSEDGLMSMKAAENVYKILAQFEPSVKAAGKMDLNQTFDNSFARKAAAKYK